MINWINFLHFYQPPTQDILKVRKIAEESYSFLLDLFEKNPNSRLTLNISGSLLEKLEENDDSQILPRLKKMFLSGQIEITGSAMYHPILPIISEEEVRHQINLNSEKLKEIFASDFKPSGFFLPEMAYSENIAKIIKSAGFDWIILDEIHFPNGAPDNKCRYEIENIGLSVLFRNREFSKSFPPKSIFDNFQKLQGQNLITAHDGEMYGHWHKDFENLTQKAFADKEIQTLTVSEYLKNPEKVLSIKPREASWESTEDELSKKVFYSVWQDPKNKIHKQLWKFEREVYEIIKNNSNDENWRWAKRHYDRGISSCFWWWASGRKLDAFSPISWNPEEIEKGAKELLNSVRSLSKLDLKTRLKIEEKFSDLRKKIWFSHWRKRSKSSL